jgi:hypothetical protein
MRTWATRDAGASGKSGFDIWSYLESIAGRSVCYDEWYLQYTLLISGESYRYLLYSQLTLVCCSCCRPARISYRNFVLTLTLWCKALYPTSPLRRLDAIALSQTSLLLWIRWEFRFIFSLYRVGDVTYLIGRPHSHSSRRVHRWHRRSGRREYYIIRTQPYPERRDGRGTKFHQGLSLFRYHRWAILVTPTFGHKLTRGTPRSTSGGKQASRWPILGWRMLTFTADMCEYNHGAYAFAIY